MINHHERAMSAMSQIKDVIVAQQHVLLERNRNEASKPSSEFGEDTLGGSDKAEAAGGFAGGDPKKRRGVSARILADSLKLITSSGMPLQDGVTAATVQKLRNGDEDRTVLAPFATLVGCV